MDVLIIAIMNMKNSFLYTQFHPLAYIVKLNIELTMASLITKIAKQPGGIYGSSGGPTHSDMTKAKHAHRTASHSHTQSRAEDFFTSMHKEHGQRPTYKAWVDGPQAQAKPGQPERRKRRTGLDDIESLSDSDESSQPDTAPDNDDSGCGAIVKTTEMAITTESIELSEREAPSLSESTRGLNRDFGGGDQGREAKAEGKV